jgi:hypothetical protein
MAVARADKTAAVKEKADAGRTPLSAKPAAKSARKKASPKMSVAEMMAAARTEKAGEAEQAGESGAPTPTQEKPASKPPRKASAGMSVTEIMAAARAVKAAESPSGDADETATGPSGESHETDTKSAPSGANLDPPRGTLTETADIIAFCRKTDAS